MGRNKKELFKYSLTDKRGYEMAEKKLDELMNKYDCVSSVNCGIDSVIVCGSEKRLDDRQVLFLAKLGGLIK
jgi:hypothetical protein